MYYQPFFEYPRILGHELSGVISSIDENARGLKAGDPVVIIPYRHCGECNACLAGKTNCCTSLNCIGVHTDGGMREQLSVPTEYLVKAEGLSSQEGALVECLVIGAHAIRRGNIQKDEYVVVVGAGPIGLGAMQFAKIKGAMVIAVDINEQRLDFCKNELGVDFVVNAKNDPIEKIKEITQGQFAHKVYDATGNKTSMTGSLQYLGHGGTLVYIGLFKGSLELDDPEFHKRETTLMASRNGTLEDFEHVIASLRNGSAKSSCFITHQCEISELPQLMDTWIKPESKMIKGIVNI